MSNPLAETVEIPQVQYIQVVADHCKKLQDESEVEMPRAAELRALIEPIIAQVKAENLMLDDAFVAQNPRAAELRGELDKHLPEFRRLATKAAERIAMIKHLKAKVDRLDGRGTTRVPVGEALVLLDFAKVG